MAVPCVYDLIAKVGSIEFIPVDFRGYDDGSYVIDDEVAIDLLVDTITHVLEGDGVYENHYIIVATALDEFHFGLLDMEQGVIMFLDESDEDFTSINLGLYKAEMQSILMDADNGIVKSREVFNNLK